jgi:ribose 5-phosphate isomerase A
VLDADFGKIDKPSVLERQLKSIPGILETGLFIKMADVVIVGLSDGGVRTLEKR